VVSCSHLLVLLTAKTVLTHVRPLQAVSQRSGLAQVIQCSTQGHTVGFRYLLHWPTVVIKTARDLLDTNQTHQRVVLHNLTQVMTYCCPVMIHVD